MKLPSTPPLSYLFIYLQPRHVLVKLLFLTFPHLRTRAAPAPTFRSFAWVLGRGNCLGEVAELKCFQRETFLAFFTVFCKTYAHFNENANPKGQARSWAETSQLHARLPASPAPPGPGDPARHWQHLSHIPTSFLGNVVGKMGALPPRDGQTGSQSEVFYHPYLHVLHCCTNITSFSPYFWWLHSWCQLKSGSTAAGGNI